MNPYAHPPTIGEVGVLLSDLDLVAPDPILHHRQGDVNATFFAGPYVVRLVKNPDEEADWATEGLAHPHAVRIGLPTPRVLFHGRNRSGRPVSVIERIVGRSIAEIGEPGPSAWRQLGGALARLHASGGPPDPDRVLDTHEDEPLDPEWLPSDLRDFGAALRPYSEVAGSGYVHGDATRDNLLVDGSGRLVLIDWGDAGWAHPAYDLSDVPLSGMRHAWSGYEAGGGRVDREFRRRTVALHLRFMFHPLNERVEEQALLARSHALLRELTNL